ncbi:hypothetical protein MMC29_003704 [Sticta canariensis]|nr:hypothetical protein [Sticta canariensis]
MQGQATFFVTFSSTQFDYPIKRFVDETYRLYGVLEIGLQNADYLANDKYSIADIATFTWASPCPNYCSSSSADATETEACSGCTGITTEKFPKLTAWAKRIQERPAVKKGLAVPNQMPIWQYLYCTEPQPDLQKKLEDGKRKYQEAVAALEKG